MSVKGVVSSVKNRERVSGSTFWRHSWHCSAYLPREVALARLTDSQLPTQQARSLENMIRAKIDNNNGTTGKPGSWQRVQDSQRSSPNPSGAHSAQDVATPHTAPVSPLHDQYIGHGRKDRRRMPGISKTQRRIKASSTPALLDRDHER